MGVNTSKVPPSQRGLVPFYQWSRAYLVYESLVGLLWVINMFIFKFAFDNVISGTQYRAFHEAGLFHFTCAITMWTVVQQTMNDNSVSWWALIPIFVALGSDISQILSASIQLLTQNVQWAWNLSLAQAVIDIVGSLSGLGIYSYFFLINKPKDMPYPVAFRKIRPKRNTQTDSLLD